MTEIVQEITVLTVVISIGGIIHRGFIIAR